MHKYTYIQAAGDKRITKRHKVRLLTIAGEGGAVGTVAAGRQCGNQEHAHRRAEHHAHHGHTGAPARATHKRADMGAHAHAQGLAMRSGWRLAVLLVLLVPFVLLARYLPPIFNGAARAV